MSFFCRSLAITTVLLILSPMAANAATGNRTFTMIPASVNGAAPDVTGLDESLAGLSAWATDQSSGRFSVTTRRAPMVALTGGVCWALASSARTAATLAGVTNSQIGILTPNLCSYAGLGGGGALHMDGTTSVHVLRHEYGHILGLGHANTGTCSNLADFTSCQVTEYGDKLDVMGSDYASDDLSAGMRHALGWGTPLPMGAGGEFRPAPRQYVLVETAKGTFTLEWVNRTIDGDTWDCSNGRCVRPKIPVLGMGVQGDLRTGSGATGLHDTVRPLPAPGRFTWAPDEVFHAPGLFRASGRDGVIRVSWDDITPPQMGEVDVADNGDRTTNRVSYGASDEGSGVADYEVSVPAGQPPFTYTGPESAVDVPLSVRRMLVRARDRAGNWSAQVPVTVPKSYVGLRASINGRICHYACAVRARGGRATLTVAFTGVRPDPGTRMSVRVVGVMKKAKIIRVPSRGPAKLRITGITRKRAIAITVSGSSITQPQRYRITAWPRS